MNIRQLNPAGEGTSAFHIFERLNTGGTPLKPQEIRNCVFRGALSSQLREANRDKNWRIILGKKNLDKHQKDVEVLLRIFALYGESEKYEKPMKEYLNRAMKKHVKGVGIKAEAFFSTFPQVTAAVAKKLGAKPFHLRGPLNVSALDAVMCILVEHWGNFNIDELSTRYKGLISDQEFLLQTVLATTDTNTVHARIKSARSYLLN